MDFQIFLMKNTESLQTAREKLEITQLPIYVLLNGNQTVLLKMLGETSFKIIQQITNNFNKVKEEIEA
jgi:hypothetical protein